MEYENKCFYGFRKKNAIKRIMAEEKVEEKAKPSTSTATKKTVKKPVIKSVETDKEKIEE